jgi:spore cortex biosynthesis protein YabQ
MTALVMLAAGVLAGSIFDIFRSLRKAYKNHPGWLVHSEDAFFMVTACALFIAAVNLADFGRVRWYLFLLAAAGAFLYYIGVSPWLGRVLTWIFAVPGKIIKFFSIRILKKREKHYIMNQQ